MKLPKKLLVGSNNLRKIFELKVRNRRGGVATPLPRFECHLTTCLIQIMNQLEMRLLLGGRATWLVGNCRCFVLYQLNCLTN